MPILLAAAQSEAAGSSLSPVGFGVLTGVVLLALLGLTYAFRNAGNRH